MSSYGHTLFMKVTMPTYNLNCTIYFMPVGYKVIKFKPLHLTVLKVYHRKWTAGVKGHAGSAVSGIEDAEQLMAVESSPGAPNAKPS